MNIEEILLFKEKKLVSNVINPKNNARNDGININAKVENIKRINA